MRIIQIYLNNPRVNLFQDGTEYLEQPVVVLFPSQLSSLPMAAPLNFPTGYNWVPL